MKKINITYSFSEGCGEADVQVSPQPAYGRIQKISSGDKGPDRLFLFF